MKNPWTRKFFFYTAIVVIDLGDKTLTITRSLDFFSYHLIKRFHGIDRIIEMGTNEDLTRYNELMDRAKKHLEKIE